MLVQLLLSPGLQMQRSMTLIAMPIGPEAVARLKNLSIAFVHDLRSSSVDEAARNSPIGSYQS